MIINISGKNRLIEVFLNGVSHQRKVISETTAPGWFGHLFVALIQSNFNFLCLSISQERIKWYLRFLVWRYLWRERIIWATFGRVLTFAPSIKSAISQKHVEFWVVVLGPQHSEKSKKIYVFNGTQELWKNVEISQRNVLICLGT